MTAPVPERLGSPYERVMRRTEQQGECLVFTGSRNNTGYGRIGRGPAGSGSMQAHRAVWEHHHGSIPEGMFVCHSCDNPPCVNIDHLWLGTPAANTADMMANGREYNPQSVKTHCPAGHPYDEKNARTQHYPDGRVGRECRECKRLRMAERRALLPKKEPNRRPSAVLTIDQVRAIREDGRSQSLIAREYGVDPSTISHIKTGWSWSGV